MIVTNLFPKKEQVLIDEFSKFDNFFPIATVELENKGIRVPIHVVHTFFQASNANDEYFSTGEYGGNFSFEIIENRSRPTFNKEALKISDDYKEFLHEAMEKYRSTDRWHAPINFLSEPEWWQGDDTPLTGSGDQMKFICQLDLVDIVDDDCRLFIFFDVTNNKVRHVYQRD